MFEGEATGYNLDLCFGSLVSPKFKMEKERKPLRVGICLTKSKKIKLKLPHSITDLCVRNNIRLTDINLDIPLESQGPFDIILHKILEFHNEDMEKGREYFEKFQKYVSSQKNLMLLDPVKTCRVLSNRLETLEATKRCEFRCLNIGKSIFVPNFCMFRPNSSLDNDEEGVLELRKKLLKDNNIKYPIVVKHFMASSFGKEVHDMSILFCDENLMDVQSHCILQQFCNHDGLMLKIYAIDSKYYICKRPSIKNLEACARGAICFNSSDISKRGKHSPLHDPETMERNVWNEEDSTLIEKEVVIELLDRLQEQFSFHLLGIDVIVDKDSGNYGIIDVNYFPGYDGVKAHFPSDIVELLVSAGRFTSNVPHESNII